ncbi:hypothetical protein EYF80_062920 [Liparis tanakae]|uniref:Uncharacterized protein n=1 Tax=Liparis tanakae TaxID=230148 RepID=A0A4Z2EEG3_9TELE|nr:hypothetical protein EYF80_062920 [Liparis tanakae]
MNQSRGTLQMLLPSVINFTDVTETSDNQRTGEEDGDRPPPPTHTHTRESLCKPKPAGLLGQNFNRTCGAQESPRTQSPRLQVPESETVRLKSTGSSPGLQWLPSALSSGESSGAPLLLQVPLAAELQPDSDRA